MEKEIRFRLEDRGAIGPQKGMRTRCLAFCGWGVCSDSSILNHDIRIQSFTLPSAARRLQVYRWQHFVSLGLGIEHGIASKSGSVTGTELLPSEPCSTETPMFLCAARFLPSSGILQFDVGEICSSTKPTGSATTPDGSSRVFVDYRVLLPFSVAHSSS